MRIFSLLASGFFSITISGLANASGFFVGGGVGVMDGLVLETGYKINPFLAIRARGTYLPQTDISGVATNVFTNVSSGGNNLLTNLSSNLTSKAFDFGLEFRPAPFIPVVRSLSIIGAIQYLDTDMQIKRSINGSTEINGNSYPVTNGYIDFVISNKQKFAPFIGIGYDILNLPFISLRLTAGGSIRSFEVSSAKYNLSGVPQVNIDAEIKKLNDKVNKTVIVPSLSLIHI